MKIFNLIRNKTFDVLKNLFPNNNFFLVKGLFSTNCEEIGVTYIFFGITFIISSLLLLFFIKQIFDPVNLRISEEYISIIHVLILFYGLIPIYVGGIGNILFLIFMDRINCNMFFRKLNSISIWFMVLSWISCFIAVFLLIWILSDFTKITIIIQIFFLSFKITEVDIFVIFFNFSVFSLTVTYNILSINFITTYFYNKKTFYKSIKEFFWKVSDDLDRSIVLISLLLLYMFSEFWPYFFDLTSYMYLTIIFEKDWLETVLMFNKSILFEYFFYFFTMRVLYNINESILAYIIYIERRYCFFRIKSTYYHIDFYQDMHTNKKFIILLTILVGLLIIVSLNFVCYTSYMYSFLDMFQVYFVYRFTNILVRSTMAFILLLKLYRTDKIKLK